MDATELEMLDRMRKAGKGAHFLIDILGRVGLGQDPWTQKQRAILRRLAARGYVRISWTPVFGDQAGRYNGYELTDEGRDALQRGTRLHRAA